MYAGTAETHAEGAKKRRSRVRPFDGRYIWEQRRRAVVASLSGELQREPSARDELLVNNIAAATVRLEQLQDKVTRGQDVDDEALSRATNLVTRLFKVLGIKSAPAKAQPSLEQYLAAKHGEGEA